MSLLNIAPIPHVVFTEFDNVFYESSIYSFDKLVETSFLKNLFLNLHSLMRDDFSEYIFYIFSGDWERDILPESALLETNKKKALRCLVWNCVFGAKQ